MRVFSNISVYILPCLLIPRTSLLYRNFFRCIFHIHCFIPLLTHSSEPIVRRYILCVYYNISVYILLPSPLPHVRTHVSEPTMHNNLYNHFSEHIVRNIIFTCIVYNICVYPSSPILTHFSEPTIFSADRDCLRHSLHYGSHSHSGHAQGQIWTVLLLEASKPAYILSCIYA